MFRSSQRNFDEKRHIGPRSVKIPWLGSCHPREEGREQARFAVRLAYGENKVPWPGGGGTEQGKGCS